MQKCNEWIKDSTDKLKSVGILTASLDSEIILAKALDKSRTFLHAHNDHELSSQELISAEKLLARRLKREPLAYIVGSKEFYSRDFLVTASTLIPRPESEQIIEYLHSVLNKEDKKYLLADVGTGSGCLGITAKLEFPNIETTLIDISEKALDVAQKNAKLLNADVTIMKNNLLYGISETFDVIIANLPYIDKKWNRSPETYFEPESALIANDSGMELIKILFSQCQTRLNQNGYLLIEADPIQHIELINSAMDYGLEIKNEKDFILLFKHQY